MALIARKETSNLIQFIKSLACAAIYLVMMTISIQAKEVTLFGPDGSATAYIDSDNQLTIYLWNGEPVAYLRQTEIYGFNGKHLGWFKDGIVWDRQGFGVGFIKGAVAKMTKLEPLKSLKQLIPLRALPELPTLEPIHKDKWSQMPLELFLSSGKQ